VKESDQDQLITDDRSPHSTCKKNSWVHQYILIYMELTSSVLGLTGILDGNCVEYKVGLIGGPDGRGGPRST
jgi:hypothetical protein